MPVKVQKLIESFLSDITIVIPELGDGCISIRDKLVTNADMTIREIVACLGKHDEAIVARRDDFIMKNEDVLPGIKIAKYWNELSETSKDTVWKYLNLLLLAGAKHVRALDRKNKSTPSLSATLGVSDEDVTSEIANKLRDPELREKILETIRETMESMPDEDEDGDGGSINPLEKLKEMESLVGELKGTQIGKLVEEIAAELSGDISPAALGLPAEGDLKSMKPQDLMGLIAKPDLLKKIMGIVSKIGTNLNARMESGDLDRELLAKEGQEILSKSQNLLKALSPQAAKMLSSMQGGKVNSRKIMRAAKKLGADGMMSALTEKSRGGSRLVSTKDRLRKKLEERRKVKETGDDEDDTVDIDIPKDISVIENTRTSKTSSTNKKRVVKKKSKKHH